MAVCWAYPLTDCCGGTGRREASSLRAFQESLKSWALQRMNECTADVARLGCRLIVGYVLHLSSLTLRHIYSVFGG